MRKKFLSVVLVSTMAASLLAGCGGDDKETKSADNKTTKKTETGTNGETETGSKEAGKIEAPDASGWDDSKKIYAYSWDDDFKKVLDIILDKYPQYKDFVEYKNLKCKSEESVEKIQVAMEGGKEYPSLIPADVGSAKMFLEDDSTMDLKEIGITEDMFGGDYDYALQFAKVDDQIKGVTWQSTAGSVFYRRDIAKKVLGSDDPETVQAAIADWDKFFETADKLKKEGYKIVNGTDEVYYAIINAHKEPWIIDDGETETVKFDDSVSTFLDTSKKLFDGEYTNNGTMWDASWAAAHKDSGDVFCFFACPWRIGQFIGDGSNGATAGNWGACVGPQSYYWGGTYVSVGKDTPNPELCAFICYEMAFDPEIGVEITNKKSDAVVNKEANERLKTELDTENNAGVKLFNGQNPYEVWAQAAEGIDQSASTYQDKNFEVWIKEAATKYNQKEISSVDDALKYVYDKSEKELGIAKAE